MPVDFYGSLYVGVGEALMPRVGRPHRDRAKIKARRRASRQNRR